MTVIKYTVSGFLLGLLLCYIMGDSNIDFALFNAFGSGLVSFIVEDYEYERERVKQRNRY